MLEDGDGKIYRKMPLQVALEAANHAILVVLLRQGSLRPVENAPLLERGVDMTESLVFGFVGQRLVTKKAILLYVSIQ